MITLGNMALEAVDLLNENHQDIQKELLQDPTINKYLKTLKTQLKKKNRSSTFQFDMPYFVRMDGNLIGYLYAFAPDEEKTVDLHYAVVKSVRGEHYGRRILRLATSGILETHEDIKKIQLVIQKSNMASRQAAIHAGFQEESSILFSRGR